MIERGQTRAPRAGTATALAALLFAATSAHASETSSPDGRPGWPAPLPREEVLRALEAVSSIPRPASGTAEPGSAAAPSMAGASSSSPDAPAGGPEQGGANHRTREEREEKEILAGARLILSVPFTREEGREETFVGGALFFERALIPSILEVEVSAGYTTTVNGESSYAVPFDLLLKHPFHASKVVNPYVGLGATLHLERVDGHREVLFGIPVVLGTYLWWNRHVGLDVEVGYKLLFHDHVTHELELGVGPVIHF